MTFDEQIIGFRRDRIGARLICLLNVLRLSRKFGATGTFLWLSEPDGPYPELADPCDFFAPDFVARHIRIIHEMPDLSGRRNLNAAAPGLNVAGFAQTLAEGQRYGCDTMSEVARLMDEAAPDADAAIGAIAREIGLAPGLAAALAEARGKIAALGGGEPVAIHVRRGDILDGDPWSYTGWSTKFVPDEFFRAFIARSEGPVIAFSDTPAAVTHLAQGNTRVIPVGALFDSGALSPAARDLLELLLMAGCAEVGAPVQSAFSRAAAVIGPCRIAALPAALSDEESLAANDALLERAITRPSSFFARGDFAQSLLYAAKHGVTTRRGDALLRLLGQHPTFLQRFPFLYRELAVMAWALGRKGEARRLAKQGLAAPMMRHRDKAQCRQVLLVTERGDSDDMRRATEAQFLSMVLSGRAAAGPVIPALAHELLSQTDGTLAETLMFPPSMLTLHTQPPPAGARSGPTLPLWLLRLDWPEFLRDPASQRDLLQSVDMWQKMRLAADGLGEIEVALAAGALPPVTADDVARFGHCASVLRAHGRLKRAFALLHWLDGAQPGNPLTQKRLADACFAAGNRKAGWRWLALARRSAGPNAMIGLSAALRAIEDADRPRAERHISEAVQQWPGLDLVSLVHRELTQRLP